MTKVDIVSNVFFNLDEHEVEVSGISYYRTRVHLYAKGINGKKYSEVMDRGKFQDYLLDEITVIKITNKMEYTTNLLKEFINK